MVEVTYSWEAQNWCTSFKNWKEILSQFRFVTEDLSAAGAGTDSMTNSLGYCKEGDGKASILTQLQHNKQAPAENYAEFAEEVNRETRKVVSHRMLGTGCWCYADPELALTGQVRPGVPVEGPA